MTNTQSLLQISSCFWTSFSNPSGTECGNCFLPKVSHTSFPLSSQPSAWTWLSSPRRDYNCLPATPQQVPSTSQTNFPTCFHTLPPFFLTFTCSKAFNGKSCLHSAAWQSYSLPHSMPLPDRSYSLAYNFCSHLPKVRLLLSCPFLLPVS